MAISNILETTSVTPTKRDVYDPTKCALNLGGTSCEACQSLAKVESDKSPTKESAYRTTVGLDYKKRLLRMQINYRHDPLIHRMPVEIASQIFISYLEDDNITEGHDFFRPPNCRRAWSAPFLLASVCHTWRKIALSTPQLWTLLHVHLSKSSNIPIYTELTGQWIGRSGQLPLFISLSFAGTYPSHTVAPLFDIIRECSPRWRQLTLRIATNYYKKLVHGLDVLPSLEEILLHPPTESAWSSADNFSVGRTPSLHHLEVSNISLAKVPIQWNLLTTFEATDIFLADIMGLLRTAQNLIRCKFVKISGSIGIFPLPTSLITHPSLKELFVHPDGDISTKLDLLFARLVLPKLDRFECDFSDSRDNLPVDTLCGLFGRSQCPLAYFALRLTGSHTRVTDVSLMRILQEVPTVTHLAVFAECTASILSDGLLERLSAPMLSSSQAGAEFLPRLERLEFHGRRTFLWRALAAVFQTTKHEEDAVDATITVSRRPISHVQVKLTHQVPADPAGFLLAHVRQKFVDAQEAGACVDMLDAEGRDLLAA